MTQPLIEKPLRATFARAIALFMAVAALLVIVYLALELDHRLTLQNFALQQAAIREYAFNHPGRSALLFVLIYIVVVGLSLPGGLVLTVAAGNIYGLWWGTLLISFASTAAATLPFLAARLCLRDLVERRFGERLAQINAGIERDGVVYLFSLRLLPVSPFLIVNLVMGLTSMSTLNYILVSQVGMLIGTVICVNAGTQIARIDSLGDVVSPGLLISLTLLALFPIAGRRLASLLREQGAKLRRR